MPTPASHPPTTGSGGGHRVAVERGSQHVTVTIDGRVVAESDRPLLVHETGLPVRYYLPPQDVDLTLFEPTDTHTTCPFKGEAAYWTYRGEAGAGGGGPPPRGGGGAPPPGGGGGGGDTNRGVVTRR
ncbi:DUF427 domain-containing protein, partial [Streptomyces hygroscopicus]|uniref:DUF427 domain-containing protein n=1 Tax=Streptomyces hygroscopicus TaxID=1912 RepID=UPI0036D1C2B7